MSSLVFVESWDAWPGGGLGMRTDVKLLGAQPPGERARRPDLPPGIGFRAGDDRERIAAQDIQRNFEEQGAVHSSGKGDQRLSQGF